MEHKHAALLRMAADNADQLFECDEMAGALCSIKMVLEADQYNWRPVKQTKKIKRWLWADKDGNITSKLYTEEVAEIFATHTTKLLWSETEFEVEE